MKILSNFDIFPIKHKNSSINSLFYYNSWFL
jgi:hypothetical protein